MRLKVSRSFRAESSAPADPETLRDLTRGSPAVLQLLAAVKKESTMDRHPYEKWLGAHWILNGLAELDYPPGDEALVPLKDQVLEWIRSDEVRVKQTFLVADRYRRHASQEGNVLFSLGRLGLADPRLEHVAGDLLRFQWPDGGWNCDRRPETKTSTFTHTSIALRGLVQYARGNPDPAIHSAIERAAAFLLERQLFLRKSTGAPIRPEFVQLTYPDYHFYTYLFGLKIMAEAGYLQDSRCSAALDLLESQFIEGQGWKIEKKYYQYSRPRKNRYSPVRWTAFRNGRANLFLTAEALRILRQAGRV